MAKKTNRFQALRELREKTKDQDLPKQEKELKKSSPLKKATSAPSRKDAIKPELDKKGPGRPPGRRSDPNYTQLSAYIPLEVLLSVQDELAKERRKKKQRTARPLSDLLEELLKGWLEKQKRKISIT